MERVCVRFAFHLAYLYTGTGEHGAGLGKKEYLEEELGENTVQLMRIAKVIDPLNIMNPGEVRMQLSFNQSFFC